MNFTKAGGLLAVCCALFFAACDKTKDIKTKPGPDKEGVIKTAESSWSGKNTCSGVYPSYWQDPAEKFAEQWEGQTISNRPSAHPNYRGPVFKISDNYELAASHMEEDAASHVWQEPKYDAMFDTNTSQSKKAELANDYAWALMDYIQEGNVNTGAGADTDLDWDICENKVRPWIHNPYQTYSVMKGRDFTHGLTREAPFDFLMKDSSGADINLSGAIWAVGFFNPASASIFADVWQPDGMPKIPTDNISFPQGAVIGKLLFSSVPADHMPMMNNLPQWQAAISDGYCNCSGCNMAEQSATCKRELDYDKVTLLQFDVAVKDSRAPGTEWVFATFVADGQTKAGEPVAWKRISPLGVMWGNDPMEKENTLASSDPKDPKANGFKESVIFWDTVDILNANGGSNPRKWPGHLGCNSRLNGPADKAYSTCMSCHMTASVPDKNGKVPPLAAQFGGVTSECALQDEKGNWIDAGGDPASQVNGVTFQDMDSVYFRNIDAATPFNPLTESGQNIYPGLPAYENGREDWVSLDFSLQLSISLAQWHDWQTHKAAHDAGVKMLSDRTHSVKLPER